MIGTIFTMALGIVLWAALAPTHWQVALQDWADDAVELVKAWVVELVRKVRR